LAATQATSEPQPGWTSIVGRIRQGTYLGDQTEYRIETQDAGELIVRRQNAAGVETAGGVGPGDPVVVRWHEEANLILVG
jgi:ABC-type Fe3+/spermidine/putrescine transport system ATPase subunit